MTQASQNISQQFIDGGVVPADLVGQDAVSKKYVDQQLAIRDKNIAAVSRTASAARVDIDAHKASTKAHPAQNITYAGKVAKSNNVKQGLDNLNDRVDHIVAQSGDDNTEIVDARGGYPVLGGRLNGYDVQLADIEGFNNHSIVPTYSNGLLVNFTELEGDETEKMTIITYNIDGTVNTVTETMDGKSVTSTIHYTNGVFSGITRKLS